MDLQTNKIDSTNRAVNSNAVVFSPRLARFYAYFACCPLALSFLAFATRSYASDSTYVKSPTPAVRGLVRRSMGLVNVQDYGAVCDGVTDDTASLQKAVNAALATPQAATLLVTGKCKTTASIIIDRPVNKMTSEFRIIGEGPAAGFYASSPIAIFDSSIAVTKEPKSEWITFEGIHFEGSDPALSTYVATQKFLRMKFINCFFFQIKCLSAAIYAQTWHFLHCNIRNWNGTFFNVPYAYDIRFIGCVAEVAWGPLFRSSDGVHPTSGVAFIGNLIEGLRKGAIQLGGSNGCAIIGNYFEFNGNHEDPNINLYLPGIPHRGLVISGNFFASDLSNSNDYAIHWGPVDTATSSGNFAAGRLHHNGDIPAESRIISTGDYATVQAWKNPQPGFATGNVVAGGGPAVILDNAAALTLDDRLLSIRNAGKEAAYVDAAGRLVQSGLRYVNLGSGPDGTMVYCKDCRRSPRCASGGTGAFAKRLNRQWVCN